MSLQKTVHFFFNLKCLRIAKKEVKFKTFIYTSTFLNARNKRRKNLRVYEMHKKLTLTFITQRRETEDIEKRVFGLLVADIHI